LKIYLLLLDHARFFFYSDESEASPDTPDADDLVTRPKSGFTGWFHIRYKRFRSAWQHADSGALLWMRRSWDWLHSWAHPDEAMLARLWSVHKIDLYYPAARPAGDVRAIWSGYLKKQWRRHLVWLIFNGLIAPFAFLLFVLPGPNLIGYWFAYRAVHHTLVVWGIGRVNRNKVPTELHPIDALDLPIESDADGKSHHAALEGPTPRLDDHVAWHRSPGRARAPGTLRAVSTPGERHSANSPTEKS
jgi:hypothetical protein